MGDGWEVGDEDRGNINVAGDKLQENHAVSVFVWERELGGDGGNAKITRGIQSSVIQTDYGDDIVAYKGWRVGLPPGD